jgi:hypothetical protein
MFMGGVVVEDDVDRLVGRNTALNSVEKADEFDMAVALHAAADNGAVEYAEGSEQGSGAVPLIVVRHSLTAPRLDRQAGLGAIQRLDLAFFIDRQYHGVGRRIDIEPDDIAELVGKAGIARALEGAQPVRLQFVRVPDALYRTQRDADGFGHCPGGPVGCFVRRLGAGQRHDLRGGFRRDRRLAGLAGLVVQQTVDPALGKALLPSPHGRPADADALRHLLRRVPIRRGEDNLRSLDVFARPIAVRRNHSKLLTLLGTQYNTHLLCHGPRPPNARASIARLDRFVNLLNESEH